MRSRDLIVQVLASPVTKGVENGSGRIGATTEISCTYTGKPLPVIQWLQYGKIIEEDSNKYEITTENHSDKEITAYLKIINLSREDNGTYLCQGKNEFGFDVSVMNVMIFDRPEVTIDFAQAVSPTSVYINWTMTDWNKTDTRLSFKGKKINLKISLVSQTI